MGRIFLFDFYYDIACKYTYYCNNMIRIQRMQTHIKGTGVQLYMLPEYDARGEYIQYLSSLGHK